MGMIWERGKIKDAGSKDQFQSNILEYVGRDRVQRRKKGRSCIAVQRRVWIFQQGGNQSL